MQAMKNALQMEAKRRIREAIRPQVNHIVAELVNREIEDRVRCQVRRSLLCGYKGDTLVTCRRNTACAANTSLAARGDPPLQVADLAGQDLPPQLVSDQCCIMYRVLH